MNLHPLKNLVADAIGTFIDLDAQILRKAENYILCFHRIVSTEEAAQHCLHHSMWASPKTFENVINWLQNIGEIVSLDQMMAEVTTPNSKPKFCLTFDDGWIDNYTIAFPLLRKYRLPATIFLATDAINTGNLFWADEFIEKTHLLFNGINQKAISTWLATQLPEPLDYANQTGSELLNSILEVFKRLEEVDRQKTILAFYAEFGITAEKIRGQLMDWSQIREMSAHYIDFQSHTHTHKIFVRIPEQEMLDELQLSKRIIEENLEKPCIHFCYPNARYELDKVHAVGEAGYRYGYKIDNEPLRQPFNPYLVPRILVCENYLRNLNYFKLRLLGLPVYRVR
jgi:peptidoglycan/xylan/chitin deacetylase (PgdA/CDA1 family)